MAEHSRLWSLSVPRVDWEYGERIAAYNRAIGALETERLEASSDREMKYFLTLLGFSLFFSSSAFALGPFSIGVKGGVSLTDAFSDTTQNGAGITPLLTLYLKFYVCAGMHVFFTPLCHYDTRGRNSASCAGARR